MTKDCRETHDGPCRRHDGPPHDRSSSPRRHHEHHCCRRPAKQQQTHRCKNFHDSPQAQSPPSAAPIHSSRQGTSVHRLQHSPPPPPSSPQPRPSNARATRKTTNGKTELSSSPHRALHSLSLHSDCSSSSSSSSSSSAAAVSSSDSEDDDVDPTHRPPPAAARRCRRARERTPLVRVSRQTDVAQQPTETPISPHPPAPEPHAGHSPSPLAQRGYELVASKPTPHAKAMLQAWGNDYHPVSNPNGWINLAVAENRIMLEHVRAVLSSAKPPSAQDLVYPDTWHGSPALRTAIANFLAKHAMKVQHISPDHIIVASGANNVIDLLAHVLCNPGDAVLIPTPMYNGYVDDFRRRAGVSVLPAPTSPDENFAITARALAHAWHALTDSQQRRVKAVLICNPCNPTGNVMDACELLRVVQWARKKHLHVIFNEIYGMSLHLATGKKSVPVSPFASSVQILNGDLSHDVHVVWGLSKDLCLSGARVGVLVSNNSELLKACQKLTKACSVSTLTQRSVQELLSNNVFISRYIETNRRKLTEAKAVLVRQLDALKIPFVPSSAGLFLWVDLRRYLAAFRKGRTDSQAEMRLWREITETNVLLSAGSYFFCDDPGWFRCCFATVDQQIMQVAWSEKIRPVLARLLPQRQ